MENPYCCAFGCIGRVAFGHEINGFTGDLAQRLFGGVCLAACQQERGTVTQEGDDQHQTQNKRTKPENHEGPAPVIQVDHGGCQRSSHEATGRSSYRNGRYPH